MSLPGNIPVAAESLEALMKIGLPWVIRDKSEALVLITNDPHDPCIVWASPKLRDYRAVWRAANVVGFVEEVSEWGDNVDIDHVFPRSWANLPGSNLKYVRLFPVWAEINRSAGAGLEKDALKVGLFPTREQGIVYARELQVLKILGQHCVRSRLDLWHQAKALDSGPRSPRSDMPRTEIDVLQIVNLGLSDQDRNENILSRRCNRVREARVRIRELFIMPTECMHLIAKSE